MLKECFIEFFIRFEKVLPYISAIDFVTHVPFPSIVIVSCISTRVYFWFSIFRGWVIRESEFDLGEGVVL